MSVNFQSTPPVWMSAPDLPPLLKRYPLEVSGGCSSNEVSTPGVSWSWSEQQMATVGVGDMLGSEAFHPEAAATEATGPCGFSPAGRNTEDGYQRQGESPVLQAYPRTVPLMRV